MHSTSKEEERKKREMLKILIRFLYFLVKHRIPHTTFQDLITSQIENGKEQLNVHLHSCPNNAAYLSKVTTAELLKSISDHIEDSAI